MNCYVPQKYNDEIRHLYFNLSSLVDYDWHRLQNYMFEYAYQTAEFLNREKTQSYLESIIKIKLTNLIRGVPKFGLTGMNIDELLDFDEIPNIVKRENTRPTHVPITSSGSYYEDNHET